MKTIQASVLFYPADCAPNQTGRETIRVLQKELYNGIPNAIVLRKRLQLKAYKLSIVRDVETTEVVTFISTTFYF
jgi:hypothetical protein